MYYRKSRETKHNESMPINTHDLILRMTGSSPSESGHKISPIISLCGFFRRSSARNSKVRDRILPNFKLSLDHMVVLVTCKNEEDLIKSVGPDVILCDFCAKIDFFCLIINRLIRVFFARKSWGSNFPSPRAQFGLPFVF